jgi:hypothetical protein
MKNVVNAGPIYDLELLPAVLLVNDVSRVYRLAVTTIYKQIRAGTFVPAPFARNPYRWRREDIIADLNRSRSAVPQRRKPMKAALNVASAIRRQAQ